MRSYMTMDGLWADALKTILEHGSKSDSRAGMTTEILGYGVRLLDIRTNLLVCPDRLLSRKYALAEMLWYLIGSDDVRFLTPFAPSYMKFAEEGSNRAYGAYGKRWLDNPGYAEQVCMTEHAESSQLEAAMRLLSANSNSRQCVLTMWDSTDLAEAAYGPARRDVPCTICLQFHVRDGRLHAHAHMRSNDAWLGMPYDVFCFSSVQRLLADALDLEYGTYVHTVGSLHLYEKNIEGAKYCLDCLKTLAEPAKPSFIGGPVDRVTAQVSIRRQELALSSLTDLIVNKRISMETIIGILGDDRTDWLSEAIEELARSIKK